MKLSGINRILAGRRFIVKPSGSVSRHSIVLPLTDEIALSFEVVIVRQLLAAPEISGSRLNFKKSPPVISVENPKITIDGEEQYAAYSELKEIIKPLIRINYDK